MRLLRNSVLAILLLTCSALGQSSFSGGTIGGNILPDTTGRNLGSAQQRWNAFVQNLTISGTVSGLSQISVGSLNGIRFADQYAGADIGAKINAAFADCSSAYCTIIVPPGTYAYSTDIYFSLPSELKCEAGTVLNYTGSGKAAKFGPDGLTVGTYQSTPYIVNGCQWTGGASMTHGLYFNTFVVNTMVLNTQFRNFGNASAWNIFYQSQNWYNLVDNAWMWTTASSAVSMNGIKTNGYDVDGTTSDFGQSRTIITNSLIQPFSGACQGVYVGAFHSVIKNTTISGSCSPDIQLSSWSNASVLDTVYLESPVPNSGPAIMFGDLTGTRTAQPVTGVKINNSFYNAHNSSGTSGHFIGPATGGSLLANAKLNGNILNDYTTSEPMVVQNNLSTQTGNAADNNLNLVTAFSTYQTPIIHTAGASISTWNGSDQDFIVQRGLLTKGLIGGAGQVMAKFQNNADSTGFIEAMCGSTVKETCGIHFTNGDDGTESGRIESVYTGRLSLLQRNVVGMQVDSLGISYFGPSQLADIDQFGKFIGTGVTMTNLLISSTAPTISTHFNTSSDSISANNGTAAFTVTVGTGAGTTTGVLGLPTATTGWHCMADNLTRAARIQQTASSTTSATLTNMAATVATPTNWTNSDVLAVSCFAY